MSTTTASRRRPCIHSHYLTPSVRPVGIPTYTYRQAALCLGSAENASTGVTGQRKYMPVNIFVEITIELSVLVKQD